jgi:transcription elongation factor GreA
MSADEPVPMTQQGIERLRLELEELEGHRLAEATANVRAARGQGADLVESTVYAEAKTQLAMLHERIAGLRQLLGRVQLISATDPSGVVCLGSRVTLFLEDEREEGHIPAGRTLEPDPLAGHLSNQSPLGRALLGKKVGQKVRWALPGGRNSTAPVRAVL